MTDGLIVLFLKLNTYFFCLLKFLPHNQDIAFIENDLWQKIICRYQFIFFLLALYQISIIS
jgi:hypothetical protein